MTAFGSIFRRMERTPYSSGERTTDEKIVRITISRAFAVVTTIIAITGGCVAFYFNLRATLLDSDQVLSAKINTVISGQNEVKMEAKWIRKNMWTVSDQQRWSSQAERMNRDLSRPGSFPGFVSPDPYAIHGNASSAASSNDDPPPDPPSP